MEKIAFETENGETREFFVEEETRIAGVQYLLVSDSEEGVATAYILKDLSADGDPVANYVMVEDDVEFEAVSRIFEQMMEDTFERV
ncbi:MAG: DUF1292 domain-containing protein [Eubacterium sp.]|nr:DUF1292 domain-containing protein [Eubacterium sp.]